MDLAAWSEQEQLERLERLARASLAAWGRAGAEVAPLKYRENAVFRVTGPDGARAVLRVHRAGYRSDAHIRSEAAWMHALGEAGIDAPDLLPTRDGDVVARVAHPDVPGPRQCDLMTWVEGRPLGSLEHGVDLDAAALRAEYRTVGAIAARIETHGATWVRPEGFARPRWDTETLVGDAPAFGAFWELPELEPEQRALLLRARDHVREALVALGPAETLVHGDLIPDNLLVADGTVRVIDFDDCGFSWPVFELVTSVFPLLVTGGFEAGLQGYLEGYRSVRSFPETELAHVPTVLLARGLSYLGWPVGRPEIHSQRAMVPLITRGLCDFARQLLDGPR